MTCILTAVRLIRHVSTIVITIADPTDWNTAAGAALELVVTACCTATLTRSSATAEKQCVSYTLLCSPDIIHTRNVTETYERYCRLITHTANAARVLHVMIVNSKHAVQKKVLSDETKAVMHDF